MLLAPAGEFGSPPEFVSQLFITKPISNELHSPSVLNFILHPQVLESMHTSSAGKCADWRRCGLRGMQRRLTGNVPGKAESVGQPQYGVESGGFISVHGRVDGFFKNDCLEVEKEGFHMVAVMVAQDAAVAGIEDAVYAMSFFSVPVAVEVALVAVEQEVVDVEHTAGFENPLEFDKCFGLGFGLGHAREYAEDEGGVKSVVGIGQRSAWVGSERQLRMFSFPALYERIGEIDAGQAGISGIAQLGQSAPIAAAEIEYGRFGRNMGAKCIDHECGREGFGRADLVPVSLKVFHGLHVRESSGPCKGFDRAERA